MAMEKTFNAAEAEARIYEKWESAGAFKAGANAKEGADSFTIMIPPPNVTGALHVGHAFNNTIQDILIRWHRMRGFDTLWQPGQDHAGIATQLQVEKMLAATGQLGRRDLGRDAFLEKVWEWKGEYGSTIINQLKRLGSSCDWSRNAFTMSGAPNAPAGNEGNFHDAVIKVFVEMYNKGLIYRGKRLVNWDPHFETAISDLEVENIETDGHMWHFKYPLAGGETYTYVEKDEDGNVIFSEERDYISIATTRPETMLGDGAVAVHHDDERYAPIVGKLCEIPVGPKEQRRLIPIITDEYPDMAFGSGAVKITGAHDFNDHEVAKRGNIPQYRLMDTRGAMRADGAPYAEEAAKAAEYAQGKEFTVQEIDAINLVPDEYRGLDRFEARQKVIDAITAEGLAVMTKSDDPRLGPQPKLKKGEEAPEVTDVPLVEAKKIMQPFGDRSKVVIEPMLTDQWFVETSKIVGPALDAVRNGDIKIMPESGEKTYYHWLENIEPWCISRQLWWGHQIPVWYDDEGNAYCAPTEAEAIEQSGGKTLKRDPDVLDTWFSSGLWPIGTLGWPEDTAEMQKYFPTDVLVTGFDILFFWVARMIMMQLAVVDEIPFHTVYLHQLVRDEKGKKMSKTTGNVIDPLVIIDEYGADALRFTNASMAAIGGVLKLSEDRIKGYRNFSTKLWNASRFAEMNGAVHGHDGIPAATATVNKWIIGETARVREEVDAAIAAYRFNDAASALYGFVWGKVCDWYVEFSKPLLMDGADDVKAETQKVMGWVIDQCLILLHPIMPFITEELWDTLGDRSDMLALTDWPTYTAAELVDASADQEMNWAISMIEGIRSARAQMNVPVGLYVPVVMQDADANAKSALANNETLIKRLARVGDITEAAEAPKGSITITTTGATFALPLADIIDVDKEKARIEKAIGKLAKEIGGLKGRLNNPKFVESAPEEVIEESKANLALREEEDAQLKAALARLAEIG
ncbi:valine--tRNA ligase [Marivivens niveibacter]|uniref:Valine--tRNA ligase n=1 Tax=Marivivens niveibacter TaxID=1930667 RepID=A0A251X2E2_9RHOB|nr:valine--tRNA ligase [Marivivens niveibacter]OUD10548.1 valine--tRNA ligase [Marivivens niveibacter]